MYTLESLPLIHVWLDAEQLASTARILMDGYRVPAIAVVDSDHKLIGWVTPIELVGATIDTKLADIMVSAPECISSKLSVRDAAGELLKFDRDFLPVEKNGRFYAIVTSRSLLGKLRESYDPMTDLPWSDALREWGTEKLEQSVEVAILFIDLNHFGQFNKQFGHVVGDRVIQKVALHLKSLLDPTQDMLVRYGGDEFAIGTTRHREEAEALMAEIIGDGSGLVVEDVSIPVTFTIGIYGGLRTKARNNVHGPSNVDNLVNLASKDCLAKKAVESNPVSNAVTLDGESLTPKIPTVMSEPETASKTSIPVVTTQVADVPRPVPDKAFTGPAIETIQADDEPGSLTYVVIKFEGRLSVGVSPKMGSSRIESIAIATGKALEKAFPDTKVTVDSVNAERAGSTELVTARVRAVRDGLERDITAQAEANGDLDDTVGLVVISAFLAE